MSNFVPNLVQFFNLQEYLNAAEVVNSDNGLGWFAPGHPSASTGFTLLESSTDVNHSIDPNHNWINDGMFAQALEDKHGNIIIAFDSSYISTAQPQFFTPYGQGSFYNADLDILHGKTPQAFLDADAFTKDVVHKYGSSHNIVLEGHSLGGAEAEYVANLEHLSGVTFGSPGTNDPHHQPGNLAPGQYFIDIQDKQDPFVNFGHHFGTVVALEHDPNYLAHTLASYAHDLGLIG
jgi:hypothetical protein